jgi:hypothetical protein
MTSVGQGETIAIPSKQVLSKIDLEVAYLLTHCRRRYSELRGSEYKTPGACSNLENLNRIQWWKPHNFPTTSFSFETLIILGVVEKLFCALMFA